MIVPLFRRPIKEINAEFSAEDKYLDSIQRTVRESCGSAGLSSRDTQAILLATEEAATNIIRHAYLYQKGVLRLRIVIYPRLVVFSFIDFGRSFQPDASGTVDLQKLVESGRKGGLGFYMIRKIMDSVQYISSAGRNELRMIKRIDQPAGGDQPMLRRMFSLRAKFTFSTVFIVLFIVGGAFYFMDQQTARQLQDRLDRTVAALVKTVADQTAGYLIRSRSDVEFDELVVNYTGANEELELLVLTDRNGRIRAHSEDARNIGKVFEPPPGVNPDFEGRRQSYMADGEELYYLVMPVMNERQLLGYAHAVYSDDPISEPLAEARRRIIILTLLLLLFGLVGIYMLSNYFVRPIVNITRRVRRFASGDLESELPLEGAEEFFEISRAFNEIMTRLAQDRKNIAAREKMAREIEVASQIQRTLLPGDLPRIPGLDIDAFYRAASVVGGDLYDVFAISEHRYCLVVADVSGKGVPASLVMSMLRTVVQISAPKVGSAREILLRVNDYMNHNIPSGMFVTIILAVYDDNARSLDIVSAGHNALLLRKAGQDDVQTINPGGMPLGMPATIEKPFEERLEGRTIDLDSGDCFVMFTDGITEAVDREGGQFGLERFRDLFARTAGRKRADAADITRDIVGELDEFVGFTTPPDDMTLLVGRVAPREDSSAPAVTEIRSIESGSEGDKPNRP
jgi:serine phosphatase RsbU (regulator of sigma subunit)/anti-sigma regulatory factor (Ser/Thr protein kinase)